MTTTQLAPGAAARSATGHPPRSRARDDLAVLRLGARLVRRPALVVAASLALYVVLEIVSYERAYPDAASRARIAQFGDVGATRALQGAPHGVETVGGFVAWDGGWVIETILAVWIILLAGRLLRGEEDDGRVDWILAGPVRPARALLMQLVTLVAAGTLASAAVTAAMLARGCDPAGSLLFGAGLAGFAATFAAGSALTAQLFGLRRRAVGAASIALGAAFVVRMVADSADSRGWMRLLTPHGWVEELEPFSARRPAVLLLLAAAPVVLGGLALALRARRDLGSAVVAGSDRHAPHLRLLGSPEGFAWRGGEGVLLAWVAGLGAVNAAMGTLVRSMTEFLAGDESMRKSLESLGLGMVVTADGFVGMIAVVTGVAVALYACWRVAAVRTEEASGRAELLLAARVTRGRWLAGHLAVTVGAVAVVILGDAVAIWAGAVSTGADVSLPAALGAMANTAPAVCLFIGVSVLTLGLVPRLTAVLPATLVAVTYLVEFLGGSLRLPGWALDLSPFHHLAYVPAQPFAATSAAVMTGIGVLAALAGAAAFLRRDVRGA